MSIEAETPTTQPVADAKDVATETKIEAFANDPVSPETSAPAPTSDEKPKDSEMATETPAATDGAAVSSADKEEPSTTPSKTAGNLGYKGPGLLSHLRFSSRYVWLGDEPVPAADLKQYLTSDKSDVTHPTVAWSSQSGKGLLYFVKREEDKKTPSNVINLADISDLAKGTANDFSFKLHGKEHAFQAESSASQESWYTAIESASQHALGLKEDMVSSSGYKEVLSNLGTPVAGVGAAAAGAGAVAGGAATVAGAEATDHATTNGETQKPVDPVKESLKSKSKERSASRSKRSSIFGGILGKKDEQEEKKEEDTKAAPEETAAPEADKEAEKKQEDSSAAVAAKKEEEKKAKAAREQAEKDRKAKEQAEKDKKTKEKAAAAAKKEQEKKDKAAKEKAEKEKKAQEKAAAEAKKEQERKDKAAKAQAEKEKKAQEKAAAEKAEAKAQEEKAEAAQAKAAEAEETKKDVEIAGAGVGGVAVVGAGAAAVAASGDETAKHTEESDASKTTVESTTPSETTKTAKSAKRNSIFGFFQKASTPTTEKKEEETVPTVAANKDTAPAATEAEKTETTPAEVAAPIQETTETEDAPATATTPTEKRRSSFFGLGGKKDKAEKDVKTESTANAASEDKENAPPATDGKTAKQPSKLSEFIRRPSQLLRSKKEKPASTQPVVAETDAEGKPQVDGTSGINEGTEKVLESAKMEPVKGEGETEAVPESTDSKPATAIGDVVPEAVSIGHAHDSTTAQPLQVTASA